MSQDMRVSAFFFKATGHLQFGKKGMQILKLIFCPFNTEKKTPAALQVRMKDLQMSHQET